MPAPPPAGDDPSRGSDENPGIPDEVWDRFLDDSEERIRACAPREPSAHARGTAGLPRPRGGRGGPGGWLRTLLRPVLVVTVVAALATLTLDPSMALSWVDRAAGRTGHAAGGTPSGSPAVLGRRADPFAGSPARSWADGADGIAVPAARAAGGLSRRQVAEALRRTKDYLLAANLDPATLRGGWPGRAIALIDPLDTAQTAAFTRALRSPDAAHDPLGYVTRYNPAQLRLAGPVVKVRGAMTYVAGSRGSVEIRTDFSFVYPFTRAGGGDRVSRSVVRQVLLLRAYDAARTGATPGTLWLTESDGYHFNSACGVDDGYLHPDFTAGRTAGAWADPYDTAASPAGLPACGT
jgi:hypothetical protein